MEQEDLRVERKGPKSRRRNSCCDRNQGGRISHDARREGRESGHGRNSSDDRLCYCGSDYVLTVHYCERSAEFDSIVGTRKEDSVRACHKLAMAQSAMR